MWGAFGEQRLLAFFISQQTICSTLGSVSTRIVFGTEAAALGFIIDVGRFRILGGQGLEYWGGGGKGGQIPSRHMTS